MQTTIGDIVRKMETDFNGGNTKLSRYVNHSMSATLEQIYAYLHDTFTSPKTDSNGDEKPFFNIVKGAANVWYRATDIDRSDIRIRATSQDDWLDALIATAKLQEWMRKERFGAFLNEWGRVLSRYGSATVKFVENSTGLHIRVVPWSSIICDPITFDSNPVIEVLELTEGELRERITTHNYSPEEVEALIGANTVRVNKDKSRKDNRADYYKLYEIHLFGPKAHLTKQEADKNKFVHQMHVISFVETGRGRGKEYEDFTLIAGEEDKSPYMITHLIEEEDRTLAIGAVEHLFEAQWMQNNAVYHTKKQLELAGKLLFQTSDPTFAGRNALVDVDNGEILVTQEGKSINAIDNNSHDITSWQNFAVQWKTLGNEITGISEAMLGTAPKSGTAWRQTEALLQESHGLFELMTENKGLHIEDMLRTWILPYIREHELDNADEVIAVLSARDIERVDKRYIHNEATKSYNKMAVENAMDGKVTTENFDSVKAGIASGLKEFGNTRSFVPSSDITSKTWREHFKDFEWDCEIDVTGEQKNVQEQLTTLNTALTMVMNPLYESTPKAQLIVGKILELTGAMSPLEIASMPAAAPVTQPVGGPQPGAAQAPINNNVTA